MQNFPSWRCHPLPWVVGPQSPQHLATRADARDLLQIIGRTNVERLVPHATALSSLGTPSNATAQARGKGHEGWLWVKERLGGLTPNYQPWYLDCTIHLAFRFSLNSVETSSSSCRLQAISTFTYYLLVLKPQQYGGQRKYDQNSFWQRLCRPCSQSPNPRRKCDTHVRLHNIFALRSQHLCYYIFYNFSYGNLNYMFILHSQYPRFACPIILLLTMRLKFSIHTHNDFAVLTCEHVTISCIF